MLLRIARPRTRRRIFLTAGLVWPVAVLACNVPVFRYALERWPAEPYEVVVFHRGSLAEPDRAVIEALKSTGQDAKGLANVTVRTVDLSTNHDQAKLWSQQTNATLPWLLVRAPRSDDATPSVWAGPLNRETAQSLIQSPARREIARRLLAGDSAVWVLLESGHPAADDAALKLVEAELRKAEKSITLPEPAPDDPQMRTSLPLRIAFSALRLSRRDPAETLFIATLAHQAPALATNLSPVIIPMLGRGRALATLFGPQLRPEIIADVCSFVAGPCSCEVKEMNPGFDLLMAADWDALPEGRVVKDPELPPLIGMASFGTAATNRPAHLVAAAESAAPSDARGPLARNLLALLGVGVGALAVGTWVLKKKVRKRPG